MDERFQANFSSDSEARYGFIRESCSKEQLKDLLEKFGIEDFEERDGELWAKCPFHDDTNPSWSINIDKTSGYWGVHSCWVCKDNIENPGKGNIATLTKDLMGLSNYKTALSYLEKFVGIGIDIDSQLDLSLKVRLKKPDKELQVKREVSGLDPNLIFSRFNLLQIGSPGWLYLNNRGIPDWQIIENGLREGLGRYLGRVIFPIKMQGVVKTFYAASYDGRTPKGLYPKGKGLLQKTLYGFDKFDILQDTCYLVEGAFDKFSVERLLLRACPRLRNNVGATEGAVLLAGQAELLDNFSNVVILPDMKGNAKSIVPTCQQRLINKNLFIVQVPRGEDPDSQCRKDPRLMIRKLLSPDRLRDTVIIKRVDYSLPENS